MFHELMKHLVLWIYLHPNWAGLALFLISAGESMTVVGSFIPGTIIMTAVGVFIGADLLAYWPMVFWAACGALFGDALNFTLGYCLKDNVRHIWPLRKRRHWLTKGQNFLQKHGGKSIFFARFIGPLRAFAPVIAGALRMSPSRFYFIDALSVFSWAIVYLLPGILLGEASLELSPDITEHLFRDVFIGLVALIAGGWSLRFLIVHVNAAVKDTLTYLWLKMKKTSSFIWFCHIFRHHKKDHPRGQLGTLFIFLLVFFAFTMLTFLAYSHHAFLTSHDSAIHHFTESLRTTHWLDNVDLLITLLGEKKIAASMFFVIFIWLCYQRCWRAAFSWTGAFILAAGSAYLLKDFLNLSRPNELFETIDGSSYPSGHVVMATLLYGGFAYFTASNCAVKNRWVPYTLGIFLISLISCSRIFLGVHWFSDVLGSVFLGWLCLLLMAMFYQRHPGQNIQALKILPYLVVLQIFFVWIDIHYDRSDLEKKYFPAQEKIKLIEQATWWRHGYTMIHFMATDRFGYPKEKLNIQWAGKKEAIIAKLTAQGWHSAAERHNWVLEIQHPELEKMATHLHVTTRFFENKKPALIFYRQGEKPNTLIIIELWETGIDLTPQNNPLFAGRLSAEADTKNTAATIDDSHLNREFLNSLHGEVMVHTITLPSSPRTMPLILIQS